MEKLIDDILAIYRRIDKGEIEEENEVRKRLKRIIKRYERKIMIPIWREQTEEIVKEYLAKRNNGKKLEI